MTTFEKSRAHTLPARQPSRAVAIVLVLAFAAIGVGNLALPDGLHAALPVDYLVIALAVLGVFVLFHLPALAGRMGRFAIVVAFFVSLIPGVVQVANSQYGQAKLQGFAIAAVLLVAPLCLGRLTDRVFGYLSFLLLAISIVFSGLLLAFGAAAANGRFSAFGLNPIGVARLTAVGAVIAFAFVIVRGSGRWIAKAALLAAIALSAVATIATGSRGPLVSAGLASLLVLVTLLGRKRVSFWWLIALAGAAVFVVQNLLGDSSAGLERVLDAGDSGRGSLYADTITVFLAHPAGIGWGNLASYLPQYIPLGADALYPHNLFLEVGVEGGWIALIAIVALVFTAFLAVFRAIRASDAVLPLVALGLLTFTVTNAQVSSDIIGNRLMWLAIGFALAFMPSREDTANVR